MRVRRATMADLPWMCEQVREFAEASGYKNILDPAHLPVLGENIIKNHYATVSESDAGELTGLLCGLVMPHIYNPNVRCLSELVWWVPKNHRQTLAGVALLQTYISWGQRNVDMVTLSLLDNSGVNPTSLTKRGFKKQETAFVWEKD